MSLQVNYYIIKSVYNIKSKDEYKRKLKCYINNEEWVKEGKIFKNNLWVVWRVINRNKCRC